MIEILVDEGYAFDFLSIAEIKKEKGANEMFYIARIGIIKQLGTEKFNEIISSKEYKELKTANEKTFNAVNLAKENKIDAKSVDDLNMQRYFCKTALQKKFFSEDVKEKKI
jgi:hypothetical protein